ATRASHASLEEHVMIRVLAGEDVERVLRAGSTGRICGAGAPSRRSTPTERWLSWEYAQELADATRVLDVEGIWSAADELSEDHPVDEVIARFVRQGLAPEVAERFALYLANLRGSVPKRSSS